MLWFWLVAVMMAGYAVLDGFDFGAGTLHLFVARTESERRQVLAAIGPLWDGNEVWLLAGGGALFLAFPGVLAAGFSGFYLALFMVIWALALRGVAIEFRSHVRDAMWRAFWDFTFACASALMPVLLGAALGNVLRGVPLDATGSFQMPLFTTFRTADPVGILDWYTVLTGLLVLVTLTAHGALFLAWKTTAALQRRCVTAAERLWPVVAALAALATLATARVNPSVYRNLPHAPMAWAGLALFLGGLATVFAALRAGRHLTAFLGSGAFIAGLLVATAGCVWPVMLRSTLAPAWHLTALNASSSDHGLRVALAWWSAGFLLALAYFACIFRLHRGKAAAPPEGQGY